MDADAEEGFREFVTARFRPLRTLAYMTCGDWHRAEDVVADSLSRLYLKWGSVAVPEHYARTMVVRAALGERRRPWRRERPVGQEFPEVPGPDRSGDVDERLRLRAALRRLPARQRATLVLRFLEGLSVEETAETLGVSAGTVKSQTSRGLDGMRAVLSAEELRELSQEGDEHVVSVRGRR
ncbi:SigE family RNA polymerase sigma factor [Actinoplanes couchii]|uniref:RNA polymerase sigma24 factor n=1 Tax=Actinoplanes couchii TaxID=403638 RepID=A0ABQ3XDP5_9ACTN|nr:SigE family RNA polymerase sigma factor [Actinoplanes couchii]MDR6317142.1 RNA polymerase sigma-70 factor (sigma-E family) [Actinoplanes couchii]GID56636.1 RNA polymerase sigma24 factor [Actinoplanes couchii]